MKKVEIKKIWKENKKEIIIGSTAFVGGIVLTTVMRTHVSGDMKVLVKELKHFNPDKTTGDSIAHNINQAMKGSRGSHVFWGEPKTVTDAADYMINFYKDKGWDLETTKLTGLVTFVE